MKRYTKAERVAFNTRANAILARFPEVRSELYPRRAMSDIGPIQLCTSHALKHGDSVAGINARVSTEQFGDYGDSRRALATILGIALPSGKWNICGFDPVAVLDEFEDRLARVNARPPTPEEAAAWDEADAAEAAIWAARRAEWAAEKNLEPVSP